MSHKMPAVPFNGAGTAAVLEKVSQNLFASASEWLGMLDNPTALRDGGRLFAFARKVERLANEASRLGI